MCFCFFFFFFFFNDTATTEIYTLSLHDALPIPRAKPRRTMASLRAESSGSPWSQISTSTRSEEHTSELQSPYEHGCRLLLEKKKTKSTASAAARILSNSREGEATSKAE